MILRGKLRALLNTCQTLMNERKFDDALSFYRRINSIFNNLKIDDQEEFIDEVDSFNYDIMLYYKIKEAIVLFENQDDLEIIKNRLNMIEGRIEDIKNKYIHAYVRENFERLTSAYSALKHKDIFARRLLEIYFFLDTGLVDTAIDKYYELVPVYNSLARFANFNQRTEMYKLLKDAYTAIQNRLKKEKSHDLSKKVIENKKVEVINENLDRFRPKKVKKTKVLSVEVKKKMLNFTQNPLTNAKLHIKQGNIEEAERLLSKL